MVYVEDDGSISLSVKPNNINRVWDNDESDYEFFDNNVLDYVNPTNMHKKSKS